MGPHGRVDVPHEVQARLRALIASGGKGRTREALRCSVDTLNDATAPGATLRPETLARVEAALEALEALEAPGPALKEPV